MLLVFNERGEKCSGEWIVAEVIEDKDTVAAVIRNAKGTPIQVCIYNEEALLSEIEHRKLSNPTIEMMQQITVLSAGLFAVRQYKLIHGIRLTYRYCA